MNPKHIDIMSFKRRRPYLCVGCPSLGIELMMRIRQVAGVFMNAQLDAIVVVMLLNQTI